MRTPQSGADGTTQPRDYLPFIVGTLLAGTALLGRAIRDTRRTYRKDQSRRADANKQNRLR